MCYEKNAFNVLNTELKPCSTDPLTGFYRDGHCRTFNNDVGEHIICSEMTIDFLNFSKRMGNDLITAVPEYNFTGLKPGDRWCLCADRWLEALNHDIAPNIILESTHIKMLEKIEFNKLKKMAEYASSHGMEVHAGHGLTLETVTEISSVPQIEELNIGHSLISDAIFSGLYRAIENMRLKMDEGRTRDIEGFD